MSDFGFRIIQISKKQGMHLDMFAGLYAFGYLALCQTLGAEVALLYHALCATGEGCVDRRDIGRWLSPVETA